MATFGKKGELMTTFGQKDWDAIGQEPLNYNFIFSYMPQWLLIFIEWMGPCSPSLCCVFNSPSGLVSENYDYLWCLLTYLFYHQKGVVLYFCMWPYYSKFYSLYVTHSYVSNHKCLHYPRCMLPMRVVIVYWTLCRVSLAGLWAVPPT